MFMYITISLLIISQNVESIINLSDISCGLPNLRSARIIGGSDAKPKEFPWMASLTRRGGHYCGATVLNKRWMLTAAHCVCSGTQEILKPGSIRTTVGKHDISKQEITVAQDMKIEEIIPHPGYECGRPSNDVALLRLANDIEWTEFVRPACLPEGPNGKSYSDFGGATAVVAGWGWTSESSDTGGRANILQKVSVNVLENSRCQEWYKSNGKKTKIQSGQMCAGDEQGGKDSCWADSGGPLMSIANNPIVIGVVSTGIGCGRPKLPGLYTRVSEYVEWIQSTVK